MSPRKWTFLFSVLACACTSSTDEPIAVGPTGPPALRFASDEPACHAVAVTDHVPLLVRADNVLLRPPFACEGATQCGYLKVFAEGVLNNESAALAAELVLGRLANPFHDPAHPLTVKLDLFTNPLVADANGNVFFGPETAMLDNAGKPLSVTRELVLLAPAAVGDPCALGDQACTASTTKDAPEGALLACLADAQGALAYGLKK